MVRQADCRPGGIPFYSPDHDRVLWDHGPGRLDPVLYLAHTPGYDGGVDVQGTPQIRGCSGKRTALAEISCCNNILL